MGRCGSEPRKDCCAGKINNSPDSQPAMACLAPGFLPCASAAAAHSGPAPRAASLICARASGFDLRNHPKWTQGLSSRFLRILPDVSGFAVTGGFISLRIKSGSFRGSRVRNPTRHRFTVAWWISKTVSGRFLTMIEMAPAVCMFKLMGCGPNAGRFQSPWPTGYDSWVAIATGISG